MGAVCVGFYRESRYRGSISIRAGGLAKGLVFRVLRSGEREKGVTEKGENFRNK